MNYNNEPFALLESGEIEPLYYIDKNGTINYQKRRDFYKEGRNWYLDHDVFGDGIIMYVHDKIVKFLTSEGVKNEQREKQVK